jgi:acetyltransferase-like isoleucine patch superfamily enzyme
MKTVLEGLAFCLDQWAKVVPRVRSMVVYLRTGIKFRRVGRHVKVYGSRRITVGCQVAVGDYCWIEAVTSYAGRRYTPRLIIGDRVALSDLTHVSCLEHIRIGDDCLLGSKIYIGDHSHGSMSNLEEIRNVAPARRPLGDAAEIVIGEKTWIGDGAVILAGTRIGGSSIVGANSVVRLREERAALIAGAPARVIRYLDERDGNGVG